MGALFVPQPLRVIRWKVGVLLHTSAFYTLLSFLQAVVWVCLSNISWLQMDGLNSGVSNLFQWSTCLFSCQHQASFDYSCPVLCQNFDIVMPPTLFLLFKISLAIQSLLWSCKPCQTSINNCSWCSTISFDFVSGVLPSLPHMTCSGQWSVNRSEVSHFRVET